MRVVSPVNNRHRCFCGAPRICADAPQQHVQHGHHLFQRERTLAASGLFQHQPYATMGQQCIPCHWHRASTNARIANHCTVLEFEVNNLREATVYGYGSHSHLQPNNISRVPRSAPFQLRAITDCSTRSGLSWVQSAVHTCGGVSRSGGLRGFLSFFFRFLAFF